MATNYIDPEQLCYYVLKCGQEETSGPYCYNELYYLIKRNLLTPMDYVFFPEWEGWRRISEVFNPTEEIVTEFCVDEQEEETAKQAFKFVDERAEKGEELYYIATQHLVASKITTSVRISLPKSIVLTNYRAYSLRPKLGGRLDYYEFRWDLVSQGIMRLHSGADRGSFNFVLRTADWFEVSKIPYNQLIQLETLSNGLIPEYYHESNN